ncbi:hypothetical protein JHK85_051021 [Glycine max]|nr:hypothetical protein JHK85_051021 [Glycine max]
MERIHHHVNVVIVNGYGHPYVVHLCFIAHWGLLCLLLLLMVVLLLLLSPFFFLPCHFLHIGFGVTKIYSTVGNNVVPIDRRTDGLIGSCKGLLKSNNGGLSEDCIPWVEALAYAFISSSSIRIVMEGIIRSLTDDSDEEIENEQLGPNLKQLPKVLGSTTCLIIKDKEIPESVGSITECYRDIR